MKKLFVVMLLCIGLCFVACGKNEEVKEAKKTDFVVEINGKAYDLTGEYMTLLKEVITDGIVAVDYRLKEYNADGTVDEENGYEYLGSPSYLENPLYVSMNSLSENDIAINEYRLPTDVEGIGFQSSIQEILNTENIDSIEKYWLLEDEIIGIYADGELVDINPYNEMVKKEKEENKVLFDITQKYVFDYEELGWVYQETYRRLVNEEIEWCGMISIAESRDEIYFTYYGKRAEEVNE